MFWRKFELNEFYNRFGMRWNLLFTGFTIGEYGFGVIKRVKEKAGEA